MPNPNPMANDPWSQRPAGPADPLDELVFLSNLLGRETRLVQPGGGNTSIKLELPGPDGASVEALLVKGSGTDLRSITREGFTRLSLPKLGALRNSSSMSDADMMRFMAGCMLAQGPAPSVETPLHSLLPYRVIAHTHDVATMSLTNVADGLAERLVREIFAEQIVYVPYSRPGFPLAHAVSAMAGTIPANAIGMTLAHHGLVIFGDNARECHTRMLMAIGKIEEYIAASRRGKQVLGPAQRGIPSVEVRRRAAEAVLPAVRGALGTTDRVILHYDDAPDLLETLAAERTPELVRKGMATPEHLLRAGRLPLWIDLDPAAPAESLAREVHGQIARQRAEYQAYHQRNAAPGDQPLDDWAKVILVPGVGVITAFSDKKSARTANLCYRASLESMINAESIGGFSFIPEKDVYQFEHWPLERRKVEETIAQERSTKLLFRHVAVIIGGGSGIGLATAQGFAEAGAHVVIGDLDPSVAERAAADLGKKFPGRIIGAGVDVRDDASLDALFSRTVGEFGGLDCLFYTAGAPPRFAPITAIRREDLQRQLEVHYLGAVSAIGRAASIMRLQGLGGAIVASVSKAAVVPGKDAVAYAGSKAALLQALRVAAVELGPDNIRVNAINADQIETPLFLKFVEERAASRGVTVAEQLETYRKRNLMGASLIPATAVSDLAVLLASEKFRYSTGGFLTIDGGLPEAFPR
jgi:rhamnose utilization protein RhaD (predicted bifunctional aldolase and dehydrogenase)/NAD(P)-dependent dehydrogenase (short-subunit alcohol dehydrogenase family)